MGEIEATVGAPSDGESATNVGDVPPSAEGVVTVTSVVLTAVAAGTVAVNVVADVTVTFVAAVVPDGAVAPGTKLVPEMVTVLPPATGPAPSTARADGGGPVGVEVGGRHGRGDVRGEGADVGVGDRDRDVSGTAQSVGRRDGCERRRRGHRDSGGGKEPEAPAGRRPVDEPGALDEDRRAADDGTDVRADSDVTVGGAVSAFAAPAPTTAREPRTRRRKAERSVDRPRDERAPSP